MWLNPAARADDIGCVAYYRSKTGHSYYYLIMRQAALIRLAPHVLPPKGRTLYHLGMSAPFAGGFNNSFRNVSKQALRSVTFSNALHLSKLGLPMSHIAAMKKATHNTNNAVLMPN
jgi:hypothetical protein